jgi:HB1, ASXL, restriction endonuclease HTH domain
MNLSWLEIAEKILKDNPKGLHVNDIAEQAISCGLTDLIDKTRIAQSLSSSLSQHVKSKTAKFKKIPNKKGGYKKGYYVLKKQQSPIRQSILQELPVVTKQYTGKAGEHGVLSELLFYGFNASIMSVDDGIDVVASKDNKYFHIQVKTSNQSTANENQHTFTIRKSIFLSKAGSNTLYIFVLRRKNRTRFLSDYIILYSHAIRGWLDQGIVKDSETLSINILIDGERYFLNKQDVSHTLNNFNLIQ